MDEPDETRAKRAAHYRMTAVEAEECGAKCRSLEVRVSFGKIARQWRELADEVENSKF
jgi:hypothetical protein